MTNQKVHLWAVRTVELELGPDPEEPYYGSSEYESITLFYDDDQERAKEFARRCNEDSRYTHVKLTKLTVPEGSVCWVYEDWYYDGDTHCCSCSDIHVSTAEEWSAIRAEYEQMVAMNCRHLTEPTALHPVW